MSGESLRGRTQSAEVKANTSAVIQRWWDSLSPEKRAEHRAATRTGHLRFYAEHPEAREVISEDNRRRWSLLSPEERRRRGEKASLAMYKAAKRKHTTGIECILREFLLPTLLPRRRVLAEYRIKSPRDMQHQMLFVVDAYVPALRLVVEADGDYWHNRDDVRVRDGYKDEYLRTDGFTVVHFSERELNTWVEGRDPGPAFWRKVEQIENCI